MYVRDVRVNIIQCNAGGGGAMSVFSAIDIKQLQQ